MDKTILEILKEYDLLVQEIYDMRMKVRINDSPFRDATETDKLEFLREEWFRVVDKLSKFGYELEED